MERIRKEMILMERGLHSPAAGKRLANLSDSAGNAVLEALENSQHSGRLSPRLTSASLHGTIEDIPTKGKFEIDSLFSTHHHNNDTSSAEISSSENRKKINLYPEVSQDSDMNSDVEVGCPAHRSPSAHSANQHKENNSKAETGITVEQYITDCSFDGELKPQQQRLGSFEEEWHGWTSVSAHVYEKNVAVAMNITHS
ncbi:hypothetical protein GJAV_G00204340 [Gymnothorax javanicus]|nr:hypothetical protein GJAV_G00204340 [Gymnothorax javanicus]